MIYDNKDEDESNYMRDDKIIYVNTKKMLPFTQRLSLIENKAIEIEQKWLEKEKLIDLHQYFKLASEAQANEQKNQDSNIALSS